MFVLDSILLLFILLGLYFLKVRNPNFLFFCRGAILFLPPDEEPQPAKKPKPPKQPEIKILQVQYNHVKEYPMADEYDRVIYLVAALVLYVPLRLAICAGVDLAYGQPGTIASSSFTSIVLVVVLVYVVKLGLQIFWISSYNIKYCVGIVLGMNGLFYMLYFSLQGLDMYDRALEWAVVDYWKQLSFTFGKQLAQSQHGVGYVLAGILALNSVLCLISVPAVIKFGNWYTKTLKQIYYQDEDTSRIADPEQKKLKEQKQVMLKQKSKTSIRLLNIYLICMLVFLFLTHRYLHSFVSVHWINLARGLLLAAMTFINCYTLKDAIEFNGSFAYRYIGQYLNSNNKQQKQKLRLKIVPYLYLIWYHKFQFMIRAIVPLLLFLLILDWQYMHADTHALQSPPILSYTHCGLQTNKLAILDSLYKCSPLAPASRFPDLMQATGNGLLLAGRKNDSLAETQARVGVYGLGSGQAMVELGEQVLWYWGVGVWAMTVLYVLFLRKTVYDI